METSPKKTSRLAIFTNSRYFTFALIGVGILFIAGLIFEAGIAVGFHKAEFSGQLGDNYSRTFGGPVDRFGMMGLGMMANPNGAFGKVVSVSASALVISSDAEPEQQIRLASDTIIRNGRDTVATSTLTVGSYVIVLGTPDSTGAIDAKLIRIVPPPPSSTSSQ